MQSYKIYCIYANFSICYITCFSFFLMERQRQPCTQRLLYFSDHQKSEKYKNAAENDTSENGILVTEIYNKKYTIIYTTLDNNIIKR